MLQENDYKDKDFINKTFCIVFDNHKRAYRDNKEATQNKDYGYGHFKLLDNTYKEYIYIYKIAYSLEKYGLCHLTAINL